jgi:hypothetical protein
MQIIISLLFCQVRTRQPPALCSIKALSVLRIWVKVPKGLGRVHVSLIVVRFLTSLFSSCSIKHFPPQNIICLVIVGVCLDDVF